MRAPKAQMHPINLPPLRLAVEPAVSKRASSPALATGRNRAAAGTRPRCGRFGKAATAIGPSYGRLAVSQTRPSVSQPKAVLQP